MVWEKITYSNGQTHSLTFLYNGEGLTGFVLNNTLYTYRKNLFGDIIAIYQGNTKVAEYAYDAYGNCTIVFATGNAGILNPFRYRGYYYDSNIELYYLQSRYYDPETGRFINADDVSYLDPESIHGLNLYAYCLNNPIMHVDPSGHVALSAVIIGAIVGAIVGSFYGGLTASAKGENILAGVVAGAIGGALMGAAAAFASTFISSAFAGKAVVLNLTKGISTAFFSGLGVGIASDAILQKINYGTVDASKALVAGLQWGILNTISAFAGSPLVELTNFSAVFTTSLAYNFLFGAAGMVGDLLR